MSRDAAISRVTDYFEAGQFQSDLADLVTYRSESQATPPARSNASATSNKQCCHA